MPQPTPTGHLATSTPVSRAVGATDPAAGVATSGAVRITVAASADAGKAIALALVAGSVESVVGAELERRSGGLRPEAWIPVVVARHDEPEAVEEQARVAAGAAHAHLHAHMVVEEGLGSVRGDGVELMVPVFRAHDRQSLEDVVTIVVDLAEGTGHKREDRAVAAKLVLNGARLPRWRVELAGIERRGLAGVGGRDVTPNTSARRSVRQSG